MRSGFFLRGARAMNQIGCGALAFFSMGAYEPSFERILARVFVGQGHGRTSLDDALAQTPVYDGEHDFDAAEKISRSQSALPRKPSAGRRFPK